MLDDNDMEDPQAGEILPPMLLESWYAICLECSDMGYNQDDMMLHYGLIKIGMEAAFLQLKPYMQAALPHYEAGLRDTRMEQADGQKLAELAAFKELVTYGN